MHLSQDVQTPSFSLPSWLACTPIPDPVPEGLRVPPAPPPAVPTLSNSRVFFYGDDDLEKRLHILNEYLDVCSVVHRRRMLLCCRLGSCVLL